ncbi:hypothetical protein [Cyanobium sp. ATX 6F1]|uniref:hypothetical protein n=1 Tax=Cyanobium sp. ATX 6F1 TaxID=2823702 RepID=UPI0020CBB603|nr:hypothetical protein [Cyanobium sp. ATX 6F1]MCP9915552.1 hypothetical protein [Cyanobium sp. ATX 6F1]
MALRVHRPLGMSIHLLLISREERPSHAFSRIRLVIAPTPDLDHTLLSCVVGCPPEELEFTRVGPVEVAHGGQWAKKRQLDSLHWPFLDQPASMAPSPSPCSGAHPGPERRYSIC